MKPSILRRRKFVGEAASPPASAVTAFLAQTASSSFATSHTLAAGKDIAGLRIIVALSLRNTMDIGPVSSVLVGGTNIVANLRQSNEAWNKSYIYDGIAGTADDNIVINLPESEYAHFAVYETTGTYQVGDNEGAQGAAPLTHDLSLNTNAGWAVVGTCASNDLSGLSFAGLTQRGTTQTIGARSHAFFDNLDVSGGTPENFDVILTGGATRYNASALAAYG